MVAKEKYLAAPGKLHLQKTLHIGNYAAALVSNIKRMSSLQEALYHVNN
jgi:hypothetical protein